MGKLLDGKAALITGAARGIGAAIAKALAGAGAAVVVTDINFPGAKQTAAEIEISGGKSWAFVLDVTDRVGCAKLAEEVGAAIEPIAVLVNSAGIMRPHTIDSPGLDDAWKSTMAVNLDGSLNTIVAFLPALRETRGSIINMSSTAGIVTRHLPLAYGTSKAAIIMMTKNLAAQLAKDGVRVNALVPGIIRTEFSRHVLEEPGRLPRILADVPMNRIGEPEDLAGPAVFLASAMSAYVTGITLPVDGGMLIG